MSRHRDIRNLDVDAELEDDALSDGGDELTEEQEAQMNEAFESVRSVIGDAMIADLSERSIREALWELYFDVEQTVEWAFSEHERKRVAQERKDLDPNYSAGSDDGQQWSRMPKIMQAQPEGGYLDLNEPQIIYPNRLSTITERTEKTEVQSMFTKPESTVDQYLARTRSEFAGDMTSQSVDPSTIPVSPSASAVQRLSLYEVPPSNPSTLSRSSVGDPRQSTESVPAIEVIPDIPDFQSKSSKPPVRAPTTAKAPSKLSKLASSRASAISNRSESTRSTGTSTSGTTQTFSVLRPSAESRIGLSSTPGSAISKDLPPVPDASDQGSSVSSSIVRKALQRRTPSPTKQPSKTPTHLSRLSSSASSASSASSNKTLSSHKTSSTVKPMSKLALLAQQKVDASRGPKLPEPTTEYLTPIANGSSVTTAITTSYQTLYSLTDPTRSNVIPRLNVVPLQPPGSAPPKQISSPVKPPPAAKTSKLAMKAKRAQERSQMPPSPPALPEPEIAPPVLPIFQPSPVHARASPSAFASLLVDNANPHTEGAQTEPSWIGPDFNKPFSEKAPGSSRKFGGFC
ncbi:hypothetical protein DFP72DRAFT_567577 [Ephemerocybe angulata]|uniref:HBS1-like protein N-terminal domain-containing protein n=1 Tax=Ephemerocybe angulata TaxID=980116 RepID=A0A8H6IEC4_9AGAR|nr:hypothetical protein DFP72DRAFT_567577 [Tulosesus angulatus]